MIGHGFKKIYSLLPNGKPEHYAIITNSGFRLATYYLITWGYLRIINWNRYAILLISDGCYAKSQIVHSVNYTRALETFICVLIVNTGSKCHVNSNCPAPAIILTQREHLFKIYPILNTRTRCHVKCQLVLSG
jgi:hypothetical protein